MLEEKDDGRLYSRIMRRSVVIITQLNPGRLFTIDELAKEIHDKKLPEFFLERFDRQMSVPRTKDYIRYLVELGAITREDDRYKLIFQHQSNDENWAQHLSDLALEHLAKVLSLEVPQAIPYLEQLRNKFHENNELPTLDKIVEETGVSGNREQQYFKWSLYMFADVDTSPFDIRRYPVLVQQGD